MRGQMPGQVGIRFLRLPLSPATRSAVPVSFWECVARVFLDQPSHQPEELADVAPASLIPCATSCVCGYVWKLHDWVFSNESHAQMF